jgi:hypothetical protein
MQRPEVPRDRCTLGDYVARAFGGFDRRVRLSLGRSLTGCGRVAGTGSYQVVSPFVFVLSV